MSIPSSARPGVIVLFIGTLVGLVAALYGYFAPLTGVNGTLGALLAIVVSVVLLLLGLALAEYGDSILISLRLTARNNSECILAFKCRRRLANKYTVPKWPIVILAKERLFEREAVDGLGTAWPRAVLDPIGPAKSFKDGRAVFVARAVIRRLPGSPRVDCSRRRRRQMQQPAVTVFQ